jgi:hypothetical protein
MTRCVASTFILFLLVSLSLQAQSVVLTGRVEDAESGQSIAGASVRVVGTTKGTYTRSAGTFRLPLEGASFTINVRSLGYHDTTLTVSAPFSALTVRLRASAVTARTVVVEGDISPEEVIKRAIERKEANAKRISTITQSLYSKMRVYSGMTGIAEEEEESIQETIATSYEQRIPEKKKRVIIQQRRQTGNVNAASNLSVFDDFFDFTTDELTVLNTRLITPLGRDALDEYRYTIRSKKPLGNEIAYELEFEPKSRLFPGFEGRLVIIEGTYQVIEARFTPTKETAIPFIKAVEYEQRYERVQDSIWVPMYQQATARVGVNLFTGVAAFDLRVLAQTYVSEVRVNEPIIDTMFAPRRVVSATFSLGGNDSTGSGMTIGQEGSYVTVAPDADSAKSEFWDAHSYTELSSEEEAIYRKADSIKAAGGKKSVFDGGDDDAGGGGGGFLSWQFGSVGVDASIVTDRTSVTGFMYGAQLSASHKLFDVTTWGAFGLENTMAGAVEGVFHIVNSDEVELDLTAAMFSRFVPIQENRTVIRRFSTLHVTNLLYAEYYDHHLREGFDVGLTATIGRTRLSVSAEQSRHRLMPVVTNLWRPQLTMDPGEYGTLMVELEFGRANIIQQLLGDVWPVRGSVSALLGQRNEDDLQFHSFAGTLGTTIPLFATGYVPMELTLDATAGFASDATPRQYQFGALRRFPVLGTRTDLATVPINGYGGTEFVTGNAELNTSDLWWRTIGLPTYNGRGPDLILRGMAAQFVQRGVAQGIYYTATDGWYTEAGFALSRIPTFLSDLLFLRADFAWPVGPIATRRGTFGWSLTLSSPIL